MQTKILTFFLYFTSILLIVFTTYRKQKSDTQFVLGNRTLSFWLTALSAHASDMSNWLFMGYPALIFIGGLFQGWAAIGLVLFMFLNWQFIAPKIRVATEQSKSLTLNAYFESRFEDKNAHIRTLGAIMTAIFFIIYISAGLIGLGYLAETLFHIPYFLGICLGLGLILFYVYLGGYKTIAWIDLFQGFFLLTVVVGIPLYLLTQLNTSIFPTIASKGFSTSLFPSFSGKTLFETLMLLGAWGLGYFGQPQILTKFMGIEHVKDMTKAKFVGLTWQSLSLFGATLLGLIGIVLFPSLQNPDLVVLQIVQEKLSPIFSALVLCAIFAATTNVMAALILVFASSLGEDVYKKFIHPEATHKQILLSSRISVLLVGAIALILAFFKIGHINSLVYYAWTGIGGSFGPLVLASIYWKKANKRGAIAGLITGSIIAGLWPFLGTPVPAIFPSFILSLTAIYFFSKKPCQGNCI